MHVTTKVKISMSDSKEPTLVLFIDLITRNSIYIVTSISKLPMVVHVNKEIMCNLCKSILSATTRAVAVLGEERDARPSPRQPGLRLRPGFKTGSGRNAIYPHIHRMSSWFGEEQGHRGQLSPVKEGKPRGLILKVCRGEACPYVRRAVLCIGSLWLRTDSLVS